MSRAFKELMITNDPERIIRAQVQPDGAVYVKRFTMVDGHWVGHEMMLNPEEWDKIEAVRQEILRGLP